MFLSAIWSNLRKPNLETSSSSTPFAHLDLLQEMVIILDHRRSIVFANETARLRFGAGYLGRDFVQLIRNRDCLDMVNNALADGQQSNRAITLDQPIRAIFNVKVSRLPVAVPEQPGVLISLSDISQLQEAEQMRSDFVANVSHELRSPLTAISGFIETLKFSAQDDPDARNRFLDLMAVETERMIRLVADLLSLSKVEARQRLRPQGNVDLRAVINRVRNSLEKLSSDRGTVMEVEAEDFGKTIPGSEDELQQVFQNLLENALKYSSPGTRVTVTIAQLSQAAGISGNAVSVKVCDQGPGIEKHHLARLTERFYRVDSHRSRNQGGTGLGLAIVKHIVQRHRGRLKVESEVGQGSCFTVLLPAEA